MVVCSPEMTKLTIRPIENILVYILTRLCDELMNQRKNQIENSTVRQINESEKEADRNSKF